MGWSIADRAADLEKPAVPLDASKITDPKADLTEKLNDLRKKAGTR